MSKKVPNEKDDITSDEYYMKLFMDTQKLIKLLYFIMESGKTWINEDWQHM